jgi:hypothetical protein
MMNNFEVIEFRNVYITLSIVILIYCFENHFRKNIYIYNFSINTFI